MRNRSYCFKRFRDDLKRLGFRHRRGHDLRRTMISLSREDGARKDILELCTHNPKKTGSSIDVYTTFPWEALCREVERLVVRRRDPGQRAQMRAVALTCAPSAGEPEEPPPGGSSLRAVATPDGDSARVGRGGARAPAGAIRQFRN